MEINYRTFYLLTQRQIELDNYVTLSRRFTDDGFVVESLQTFDDLVFDRRMSIDAYNAETEQKSNKAGGENQQNSWQTF